MTRRESLRRYAGPIAAASLCLYHFASFDIARQPLVTDVRYFLYFAWRVTRGAVPHLDYFENKTQLATYVGALLHAVGELLGVDPLTAIRLGYLTLAALGGLAAYAVFRRLAGGSRIAGGLGLLAYCSFGLLGILPSEGNIPKLVMALAASGAALATHRRCWFTAGLCATLAFMDWQIGALVGVGVLITAAAYGTPRPRAVVRAIAGGATGLAPFAIFYLAHGALVEAVRQVVGASLFRGSTVMAQTDLSFRLARIAKVVAAGCGTQQWLFYLGLAGVVSTSLWLWFARDESRRRLLLPLVIYHFGVVAFSLIDFQGFGDLFLLLHSVAFFLGTIWVGAWKLAHGLAPARRQVPLGIAALLLVFATARPGFLRPDLRLSVRGSDPELTLDDQREVARAIDARIGDRSVAFLRHSEAMFLMRRDNLLPLVYWNLPSWDRYRLPDEPFDVSAARLLFEADADVVVPPEVLGYDAWLRRGHEAIRFESRNGLYSVTILLRSAGTDATAGVGH